MVLVPGRFVKVLGTTNSNSGWFQLVPRGTGAQNTGTNLGIGVTANPNHKEFENSNMSLHDLLWHPYVLLCDLWVSVHHTFSPVFLFPLSFVDGVIHPSSLVITMTVDRQKQKEFSGLQSGERWMAFQPVSRPAGGGDVAWNVRRPWSVSQAGAVCKLHVA